MNWIVDNEASLRAAAFATPLLLMSALEAWRPRRARTRRRGSRWPWNLVLLGLGAGAARLVVPAGSLGAALFAEERGLGLFRAVDVPAGLGIALALLVLDLAVWVQHVAFHRFPWLWALHRLHHADVDLDATSGGRFHPLEIVLSLAWKAAVIVALGAPGVAVVVYESLLAFFSVATHANLALGERTDRWLARVVVTPDLHRTHHSILRDETNSNFGTTTTLWDRWFGTLRAESRQDQRSMVLGVDEAVLGVDEAVLGVDEAVLGVDEAPPRAPAP